MTQVPSRQTKPNPLATGAPGPGPGTPGTAGTRGGTMGLPRGPGGPPKGNTTLVLVALGLALVAVLLMNLYIGAVRQAVHRNTYHVYVLQRAVQPGDKLHRDDVKQLSVPNEGEFVDSFKALGAVDDSELENRLNRDPVLHPAFTGQLVTESLFVEAADNGLDRTIPTGRRLISLPVDSRRVPVELKAQLSVDILAAFNDGTSVPRVLTVMENVHVTAVGSHSMAQPSDSDTTRNRPVTGYRTISIEVTEDEAIALDTIQRIMVGPFTLLLRNPDDTSATIITAGGINPEVLELIHRREREPAKTR